LGELASLKQRPVSACGAFVSIVRRPPSNSLAFDPDIKMTRYRIPARAILLLLAVRTVLASLAEGATTEQILEDFPTLSEEDVRAAIAFAAASAQEDLPVAEVPVKR
jgi:hypothetical protein